jgi:hypothetical protein
MAAMRMATGCQNKKENQHCGQRQMQAGQLDGRLRAHRGDAAGAAESAATQHLCIQSDTQNSCSQQLQ